MRYHYADVKDNSLFMFEGCDLPRLWAVVLEFPVEDFVCGGMQERGSRTRVHTQKI
jgi:hypothetical protein